MTWSDLRYLIRGYVFFCVSGVIFMRYTSARKFFNAYPQDRSVELLGFSVFLFVADFMRRNGYRGRRGFLCRYVHADLVMI